MKSKISSDVVVVGGGNAALCAALAASETGVSVTVLERAPRGLHGGNTMFTGGGYRCTYDGADDMLALMPDLSEQERESTDFGSYPREKFYEDLAVTTDFRCDPELSEIMIENSFETCRWMSKQGVRFIPAYRYHAASAGGRFSFSGGVVLTTVGGGVGVVESMTDTLRERGIEILYGARAHDLEIEGGAVTGVHAVVDGTDVLFNVDKGVVLAAGGFEANAEARVRYLGPGWELAKVRGSRYNTGDGLRMALDAGAMTWGNWSGCHAACCAADAPDFGVVDDGDFYARHSFGLGITVNRDGNRIFDEGEELRSFIYAKLGRQVLQQPGQVGWQVFDARHKEFMFENYRVQRVPKAVANSIDQLGRLLEPEGMNRAGFVQTVEEFNAAVARQDPSDIPFDIAVKDGRNTPDLAIPKSNWAVPLDTPPYEAYMITTGITFTFGGVRVDDQAAVLDGGGDPIKGLYAAGEMVGGLFSGNYLGACGLTAGSVFGKLSGHAVAEV